MDSAYLMSFHISAYSENLYCAAWHVFSTKLIWILLSEWDSSWRITTAEKKKQKTFRLPRCSKKNSSSHGCFVSAASRYVINGDFSQQTGDLPPGFLWIPGFESGVRMKWGGKSQNKSYQCLFGEPKRSLDIVNHALVPKNMR